MKWQKKRGGERERESVCEGGREGEGRKRKRERERKCARPRALSCDVIIACATVIDVRGGVDDDYRG